MSRNVNTAVKLFNEIVKGIFDRHAPEAARRVRGKPCPWLNADLKKLMIDRDCMLRKARNTKEESHWSLYKKLRNSCNNKLRQAKSLYQKDLLNQNVVGNPKNFWSTIKSIFPNKTTRTILNVNYVKEQEKANIFSKHFSSIVRSLKEKAIPLVDFVWKFPLVATSRTWSFFKVQHISSEFVMNQLKLFKRNKSTGADNLPSGLLKDCRQYIAQPLCHIFNLSIETSCFPDLWKIARIVPIYKSGSLDKPDSYRPISVLPAVSKILEKAVHQQLIDFLSDEDLLSKFQFGYRPQRSTTQAAILLTDDIRREVDKGNLVGTVFIDLSKAFDSLSHAVLLMKLDMGSKVMSYFGSPITCLVASSMSAWVLLSHLLNRFSVGYRRVQYWGHCCSSSSIMTWQISFNMLVF